MCGIIENGLQLTDALAWIDAFERLGGRVLCDGVSFAVTMPAEADVMLLPDNLALVADAAFWRHQQRGGLDRVEVAASLEAA